MNLALYETDGFHQDSTLIGEDVLREAGIIIMMMMPAPGPGPPGLSDRNDLCAAWGTLAHSVYI